MKFEDILENCAIDVEYYAKDLYDWEKHNEEQKQTKLDVNKNGGFIKTLSDEYGNQLFIMKSTSIKTIPEIYYYRCEEKTFYLMNQLIKKDFYFCGIQKNGTSFDEIEFPNEIWLTLDEAIVGGVHILGQI